jgi:hypothetical protein
VYNYGTFSLINCTLVGNHSFYDPNSLLELARRPPGSDGSSELGGALYSTKSSAGTTILNAVLWGNLSDGALSQGSQLTLLGPYDIANCIVHRWSGVLGGTANSGDDPLLLNPGGADGDIGTADDDPRVFPDSPVRNAGDNAALPPDWLDLDGDGDARELLPRDLLENARVQGNIVDIGAVELSSCPADINHSGTIDVDDLVVVILSWGPCVIAAPCPADINFSGAVDVDDLVTVILGWWRLPMTAALCQQSAAQLRRYRRGASLPRYCP